MSSWASSSRSIPASAAGPIDKVPMGAAFGKGLTLGRSQTHVHRYLRPLLDVIRAGKIDPSFVIAHRGRLDDAHHLYQTFHREQEDCTRCVRRP